MIPPLAKSDSADYKYYLGTLSLRLAATGQASKVVSSSNMF
jgi:hypothetical protein